MMNTVPITEITSNHAEKVLYLQLENQGMVLLKVDSENILLWNTSVPPVLDRIAEVPGAFDQIQVIDGQEYEDIFFCRNRTNLTVELYQISDYENSYPLFSATNLATVQLLGNYSNSTQRFLVPTNYTRYFLFGNQSHVQIINISNPKSDWATQVDFQPIAQVEGAFSITDMKCNSSNTLIYLVSGFQLYYIYFDGNNVDAWNDTLKPTMNLYQNALSCCYSQVLQPVQNSSYLYLHDISRT